MTAIIPKNSTSKIAFLMLLVAFSVSSCKKEPSETAKKLMAKTWQYSTNANLDNGTAGNISLGGDVKSMADFASEKLSFYDDKKTKKLAYEKKYGSGFLSTAIRGFFEMGEGDKKVILKEWDNKAGKEKEPMIYKIEELTDEKLVLIREKDNVKSIYFDINKMPKEEVKTTPNTNNKTTTTKQPKERVAKNGEWKVGEKLEVLWKNTWYKATILEAKDKKYKIRYDGFGEKWDEWVDDSRMSVL